jgi:hypothetical protein
MPSIDVAMIRSVATRRSFLDVLTAVVGPALYGRGVADVEGKITDVKTAFSSWDNCMKADFCKYVSLLPSVDWPLAPKFSVS